MNISLRYTFGSVWSVGRSFTRYRYHHRITDVLKFTFKVKWKSKTESKTENKQESFPLFFQPSVESEKKIPENKRFICVFKREIGKSERNLVNPSVLHFFPGVTANDWIKRVFKHTNFLVDFFSSRLKTWIVYANNKRRYCIVNEIKNQNWFVFRGV